MQGSFLIYFQLYVLTFMNLKEKYISLNLPFLLGEDSSTAILMSQLKRWDVSWA